MYMYEYCEAQQSMIVYWGVIQINQIVLHCIIQDFKAQLQMKKLGGEVIRYKIDHDKYDFLISYSFPFFNFSCFMREESSALAALPSNLKVYIFHWSYFYYLPVRFSLQDRSIEKKC